MKKTWRYKTRRVYVIGPVCCIPLQDGTVATVDVEDIDIVEGWNWSVRKAYGKDIAVVRQPNRHLHRQVMPGVPLIDHRNRDVRINQRWNLRAATPAQNRMNCSVRNDALTGFKGVQKRGGKFSVRITGMDGRRRRLGSFDTPEEAAAAYDRAARIEHGDFAGLNSEHHNEPACQASAVLGA